jgi:hypothetical protein
MNWQELARELRKATKYIPAELPPGLQTKAQRRAGRKPLPSELKGTTTATRKPQERKYRTPRWRQPQNALNRATARKSYARRQLGYTPEQQAARLEHQQLRILAGTQRRGRPRKD